MPVRRLPRLLFAFCLAISGAWPTRCRYRRNSRASASPEGEKYLLESGALEAYFPLSIHFVTQRTQAYCGVASMVMVLNALNVPAPSTPAYEPYRTFTQDNVLDDEPTRAPARPPSASRHDPRSVGSDAGAPPCVGRSPPRERRKPRRFPRRGERRARRAKDRFIIVNYLRTALGQEKYGHISPLGAYDAKADRFLILDVARYKYPPVWVKSSDLFDAMNTADPSNGGKTRGYVVVGKTGAPKDAEETK